MKRAIRFLSFSLAMLVLVPASADPLGPDTQSDPAAQAMADSLREAAGSDIAVIPAGVLKAQTDANDLATALQYPTMDIAVVTMSGAQLKDALERSVSLFPSPNTGFLQLSGLTATFSKSAAVGSRVTAISVGGAYDKSKNYTVAMPGSLARGGMGYFKVWDRTQISKTLQGVTMESLVKGKSKLVKEPRWSEAP